MSKLTAKQQAFIEEYLIDLNATQTAIRADYSAKTAYSKGQLMTKTLSAHISEAQANRSKRTQITQDMVLNELAKIGLLRADIIDQYGEDAASDFDDTTQNSDWLMG